MSIHEKRKWAAGSCAEPFYAGDANELRTRALLLISSAALLRTWRNPSAAEAGERKANEFLGYAAELGCEQSRELLAARRMAKRAA